MHLGALINQLADDADNYLDGVTSRDQARAAISESITMRAPKLNGVDRKHVTDGVMSILEREGFFDMMRSAGDSDTDDEDLDA